MANKKNSSLSTITIEEKFIMLSPMLDSALLEMKEFSKKKQDGVLNPLKVKLINRLLNDLKSFLSSDMSINYLDILDEDTLPQNSDAVLILGQYRAAMDQFREKNYQWDKITHEHIWFIPENL